MPVLQRISITLFLVSILAGCASLPTAIQHPVDPITTQPNSTLSTLINSTRITPSSSKMSAVLVLDSGWDALAQRLALVETAQHSIDIQYYIWNSDISGRYLASRLVAAADRGVRVRIMLDDINLNERESLLVALDRHPQIELRIFNPIPNRRGLAKWLNVLSDLSRLNRRMHNKSFSVDGVLSIVGGRNIGDEYFDLSDEINFRDRDVLVSGEVVPDIQTSFAQYWNSEWSYPVDLLTNEPPLDIATLDKAQMPHYKHYPALPAGNERALTFLTETVDKLSWVQAQFISDRPVPIDVDDSSKPKATAKLLGELAFKAEQQIILESAYLIFDDNQLEGAQTLNDKGIQVKALTNSMASNDLLTNHSGYAGRRHEMLERGIQLFELKPDSNLCEASTKDASKCAPITPYGLHSKSIVFDREIACIGSFNFNVRSTYINTESILVIEDQNVAEQLADNIEQAMQEDNSWRLDLHEGNVRWHSGTKTWDSEPDTGQWERIESSLLQLLPLEKYL